MCDFYYCIGKFFELPYTIIKRSAKDVHSHNISIQPILILLKTASNSDKTHANTIFVKNGI